MLINATRDASRFKKLQKLASNGTGQISENFDDNDDAPYTPREIAHMTDILFPQDYVCNSDFSYPLKLA
ncbi:hypothetical protein X798_02240 [Onchocerca flexuosa]|uniref:Uncharacterized protein n=1 Tax=Onchocerca flexuosa TaxID=387005 RepID=A0A238BZY5_9BILA|nr:hypothetical protein X798_02240 [Onchocerca flexuosa]